MVSRLVMMLLSLMCSGLELIESLSFMVGFVNMKKVV